MSTPHFCYRDRTSADLSWQEEAACRGMNPDLWYAERGEPVEEAKAVCAGCPVRVDCLDYALTHAETIGIWGGLSPKQRKRLRRGLVAS